MNILSAGAFLVMVAGLVGLWFDHALVSPSPLAIAGQCAAIALMVWARVTFKVRSFHATAGPMSGGLVTTGPYHFIRHPIYAAGCLFAWSGVLANWSWSAAGLGFVVIAGALVRIWCEEQMVTARYPEYEDYARRTKRMIPYVF
jgi:protein-S-isoprenylcysteine O-methyltransferase Ste14